MAKCGQCGNKIISNQHTPSYYAGDIRVCSKICAHNRIFDIKTVDYKLEFPTEWNKLIKQNKTLTKEIEKKKLQYEKLTEINECSNCSKLCRVTTMYTCPWCEPSKSEKYCSMSCQYNHWIKGGHSEVCWRMGRVQPTEYRATPSFMNLINDFSSQFINSCIHWT